MSPPLLPVSDITVKPFDCANFVAFTILEEFPLVDKTIKMLISKDMSKEDLDKLYAYDSLFAVIQLIGDSIDEDKV